PFRNYKCLGGCWDLQRSPLMSLQNCQIRDFGRIFSGHLNANKHAKPCNTFAIIILKTPFDLGSKISVITLPSKPINYDRCYFYVAPVSPYRAIMVNGSAYPFKCDGVNYTQVVEDTYLRVEKSEIVFKYNYRASPVVCHNNKTNKYEQVGFLNLFVDTKKPFKQQRREVFMGTTFAHKRIYQILNKYLDPFPVQNSTQMIGNPSPIQNSTHISKQNCIQNSTHIPNDNNIQNSTHISKQIDIQNSTHYSNQNHRKNSTQISKQNHNKNSTRISKQKSPDNSTHVDKTIVSNVEISKQNNVKNSTHIPKQNNNKNSTHISKQNNIKKSTHVSKHKSPDNSTHIDKTTVSKVETTTTETG
ncbi:hypothetical protein G9C98_001937, partial [Cotesia typhae]